jgi:predicted PurR-regulated permease PerM
MIHTRRISRSTADASEVPESQFERVLGTASQVATVFVGCIVLLIVLKIGETILAPVSLALVIGLMFGPIADIFERGRIGPALSAMFVVLLLIVVIVAALLLFAVPLSQWVAKVPDIWEKLRTELASLKGPLDSLAALQTQIAGIFGGGSAVTVRVADAGAVTSIALIAPAIAAQILLFLASLYFFVATRHHIRLSVLSLCVSRRMRWRTAHIFSDVEAKVSRFLLSVTVINLCVGTAVSLAMWAIGMPSPLLWGALAATVNYVPYVGQGVMVIVLASVGLGTQTDLTHILLPVGCYLAISFTEGQIVTPQFLGRQMTLNPFMIFLSITFWLWAWGPVGGLVAVPSLLILQSMLSHILPSKQIMPVKRVRRTAKMTDNDMVLANAAQVIKEGAAAPVDEKLVPPKGTAPDGSSVAANGQVVVTGA